jgi:hypothetical protein
MYEIGILVKIHVLELKPWRSVHQTKIETYSLLKKLQKIYESVREQSGVGLGVGNCQLLG